MDSPTPSNADATTVASGAPPLNSREAQTQEREDELALAPPWVVPFARRTIWRLIWVLIAFAVAILALMKMRSFISILAISAFLGIAMDPAVTHLHQKRGWKRGAAAALVFTVAVIAIVLALLFLIPGLVKAGSQISSQIPNWAAQLNDKFGISIDHGRPPTQISHDLQTWIQNWLHDHASQILGIASSTLGMVFQFFTIGMFTFYIATYAPNLRQMFLRQVRPSSQQRLGWAMDTATEETGSYFYSRTLLMVINAVLFFFVMLAVGVPWLIAFPVSLFQGFVTEFIPAVGTYIGAIVSVVLTLGLEGIWPALILLAWVIIYQQIENYFLSPKLSAKTMDINGAVAFGSALAGGALAGPIGAFVAMPIAALMTSFIRHYARPYPLAYRSSYDDSMAPTSGESPDASTSNASETK